MLGALTRLGSDGIERRLVAILSADAVGFSRLMAEDEVATLRTLEADLEEMAALGRFFSHADADWFESFIDGLRQAGLPEE